MTRDREGLLAWQLAGYPNVHSDRRNLVIHVLTVPLFVLGNCAMLVSPFTSWWLAPGGLIVAILAFGLQGRGHGLEANRPVPFRNPLEALLRIFGEQWITFPRFVLSGGFTRAWRGSIAHDDSVPPA